MGESLSKITLIFQVMGLQYFTISPEPLEDINSLNGKFKWIFVVNIMMTMCEFCGILFAIYLSILETKKVNAKTSAEQIVQFSTYNLTIVVLVVTILNSLLLRKKARQIIKNCQIISKALHTLNQFVDYETFAKEFKNSFAKLFLCFVVSTLAPTIFTFLSHNKNVFLWAMLAIYPYFFIVIVFSYWTFLVRLVREQLRSVKKSLVQLQRNGKIFEIAPETRNHDSKVERNHATFDYFVKLKRIYGAIYETSSLVNELIAVPICLILFLVIFANTSSGYKVFLSFRNDVPVERVTSETNFKS